MARKQSETEEMDLRPLLKQVVSRLSQLEQQFAILKTENRHLREQMRAPTTRGSYEIRGTDTPIHGFGRWDTSLFLDYLTKTDEFIRERMGYGVLRMNFNMFVGAVFYIANGQTNLVRLSPTTPLDRNGYPITVNLNRKKRRRTVSWEAAVRLMFERPFLPSKEDIQSRLKRGEIPPHICQKLTYYRYWMTKRPSKNHKERDSWKAKCDLLLALARFKLPDPPKVLTRAEEADQHFQKELDVGGRWWKQPVEWPMPRVVDIYDEFLRDSEQYKLALRAYFDERPNRLQEYRAAGGSLA